jgi:hypothetical protein
MMKLASRTLERGIHAASTFAAQNAWDFRDFSNSIIEAT